MLQNEATLTAFDFTDENGGEEEGWKEKGEDKWRVEWEVADESAAVAE